MSGKKVTISVSGTDGYTQSDEFTPQTQGETLSTSVPGGGQSVTDTITVSVEGVQAGQISITFGV